MISLSPIAWVVIVGMLLSAGWILVDKIGDYREQEVWAKINAAIEKTNADIGKQNSLDDRIAAVEEAARAKALDNAGKITDHCLATPGVAASLSGVR